MGKENELEVEPKTSTIWQNKIISTPTLLSVNVVKGGFYSVFDRVQPIDTTKQKIGVASR